MPNQSWTPEVLSTVVDGQNRGQEPELLGPSQIAYGRNLSIRGGRAQSRPPLIRRATIGLGKIQGASYFSVNNGSILISIDGRIFEVNTNGWTIIEKSSNTDCNNPRRARHWYKETVGSIVIQDGQSVPWIYDGADFRRAVQNPGDDSNEVPVGEAMEYSNGRLAVAVNGKSVRIGDIVKGGKHQSELKFVETYNLNGGGDFGFPGRILALASLPVVDTASGQGSLIVGCRERAYSLKTQITNRSLWSQVGFQTETFPDVGIVGAEALADVNQDLYFRSLDGIRSFRNTYGDYNAPGLTPLSFEVSNRTSFDSPSMLEDAKMVYFDNRLLCTHSPIAYSNRSIALGLVSLNFDLLSSRGQKAPPAYEGDWDGVQVAEIVKGKFAGVERCFIIGRDAAGVNGIWEVARETDQPITGSDTPTYEIQTRAFAGTGLNALKALRRADIWLSKISGPVTLTVYFRPDKYPYWVTWDTFTIPAAASAGWGQQRSIFKGPLQTRTPPEDLEGVNERNLNVGFSFQVRLVWTGQARVDYVQVHTEQKATSNVSDNSVGTGKLYTTPPAGHVQESFWFTFNSAPQPSVGPNFTPN